MEISSPLVQLALLESLKANEISDEILEPTDLSI